MLQSLKFSTYSSFPYREVRDCDSNVQVNACNVFLSVEKYVWNPQQSQISATLSIFYYQIYFFFPFLSLKQFLLVTKLHSNN